MLSEVLVAGSPAVESCVGCVTKRIEVVSCCIDVGLSKGDGVGVGLGEGDGVGVAVGVAVPIDSFMAASIWACVTAPAVGVAVPIDSFMAASIWACVTAPSNLAG